MGVPPDGATWLRMTSVPCRYRLSPRPPAPSGPHPRDAPPPAGGRGRPPGSVVGHRPASRTLVGHRRCQAPARRPRAADYICWERSRSMELWQMDIVGGFHLRRHRPHRDGYRRPRRYCSARLSEATARRSARPRWPAHPAPGVLTDAVTALPPHLSPLLPPILPPLTTPRSPRSLLSPRSPRPHLSTTPPPPHPAERFALCRTVAPSPDVRGINHPGRRLPLGAQKGLWKTAAHGDWCRIPPD